MVNSVDGVIKNNRRTSHVHSFRKENSQSQTPDVAFAEHMQRIDAPVWNTSERYFNFLF
jgi:hypothetical protein